jgi:2-oxo-4-hydroxy-4-carboxy-5-ureidoimidazoline decarboxylase
MTRAATTLDQLNVMDATAFAASLDGVFEHAPWVAAETAGLRPFATVGDLHDALMRTVRGKPKQDLLAFLNAHPVLGGKDAKAGTVTADSANEQAGLGVVSLAGEEARELEALNTSYRDKFGFPFIICARRHTRPSILRAVRQRTGNSIDQELGQALDEIAHITRLRLVDRVIGPGMPNVTGRLSTHVLDTHAGRPAQGVGIELFELGRAGPVRLAEATTNAEGRTDQPLLAGAPLRIGRYELVFHMGAYYRARGVLGTGEAFLDEVCIRFGISEPEGQYHVPLVATPWSYSTYRGS